MVQIVLVIVVYVLGPALILTWAVRRFRSGVKPEFSEVVAVTFAVVLLGLLIFSNLKFVSDQDADETQQVVSALISRYDFPVQAKYQARPAVDGIAHRRYLEIRVYGVAAPKEQEKIQEIVKKLRKQVASKPIVVNFFKEEVWQENPDGSRLPLRDQEQLMKKIRLE
ncbi:MAG: hypothetical protein OEZ68_10455 [Gammaproteobacteria bacterium]|nr:hypothetical protein [Gammaproteobacteria bacterium]MDH5801212.1 hypothetical protein [Gammaproteobacteria bacterium]